jgi:predicted phage gp36 major capsid-like protein
MSYVGGVETESKILAREAKQTEGAKAVARAESSSQTCPISEQSFMQYMQLVEEGRKRDQEVQS